MSDEVTQDELEDLKDMSAASGSKKKLLLIVGLLFVVCNIGWGAAFMMSSEGAAEAAAPPEEGATAEGAQEDGEEAPADKDGEASESKETVKKPGPMLKLDPFVVNLDEPRGAHYLRVAIELEVKDEDALPVVEERMVVLRDRFISALSSKRLSDLTRPQDKEALREELLDLSREATGKRLVKGVYFTEFLTQ